MDKEENTATAKKAIVEPKLKAAHVRTLLFQIIGLYTRGPFQTHWRRYGQARMVDGEAHQDL